MTGTNLQGHVRLLRSQKQIWSNSLHNEKAIILAIIDRMRLLPEELKKEIQPMAVKLKEATTLINDVIYDFDTEMRDALKHSPAPAPDKEPK